MKVEKGLGCKESCTSSVDVDALHFEIIFTGCQIWTRKGERLTKLPIIVI